MTDDLKDTVSALKVQRDSAHRQLLRVETENRLLRAHQEHIRTWLAEAIEEFEATRGTSRAWEVADRIHQTATAKLADTQGFLP